MVYSSPQIQIYQKGLKDPKQMPKWIQLLGRNGADLSELTEDDLNNYVDQGVRLFRCLPDVVSLVDPLYLSDIDVGYCTMMIHPVVRGLGDVYRHKSVQIAFDEFSKNTLIHFHFAVDDAYLQSGYIYEALVGLEGTFEIFVAHAEASATFLVTREGIPVFLNFKIDTMDNVQGYSATGLPKCFNWLSLLALKAILIWKHRRVQAYIQRFGQSCLKYAMDRGLKDLLLLMEPLYLPDIRHLQHTITNGIIMGIYRLQLKHKVEANLNRISRGVRVKVTVLARNIIVRGECDSKVLSAANGDFKIGIGHLVVTATVQINTKRLPTVEDVTVDEISGIQVMRAIGRGVYSSYLMKTVVNSVVNSVKNAITSTLQIMVRNYVKRPLTTWANDLFASLLEVNLLFKADHLLMLT